MRPNPVLCASLACAFAGLLVMPGEGRAFALRGESLDTTQRDFRIFNNFSDNASNNNTVPHPMFPRALGADVAIWKAAVEWGSSPHGDGSGDPLQSNLGDGDANFDFVYAGSATGPGSATDNIFSATSCGAGVLAFTEFPSAGGWRNRFCDDSITWADGPAGVPAGQFDIQSVAAHQFGLVLGLGNVTTAGVTMNSTTAPGTTLLRSIEADDIAGIQAIYGARSLTKPAITGVLAGGTTLTISGANFAAVGNVVWFTAGTPTAPAVDPTVRVFDVASTIGGTQIVVPFPGSAGPGDVLVKVPGLGGDSLSNAFPISFPCFTNTNCPAELTSDPILADSGGDPNLGPKIGSSIERFNAALDCSGAATGGLYIIELRKKLSTPLSNKFGLLWLTGPKLVGCVGMHAQDTVECFPGGAVLPDDPSLVGFLYTMQGFCGGTIPGRTSNAIVQGIGI